MLPPSAKAVDPAALIQEVREPTCVRCNSSPGWMRCGVQPGCALAVHARWH